MECQIDDNMRQCTCTYEPCSRKGKCCDCISYHRKHGELPGCLFPPQIEKSYDRSISKFIEAYSKGRQ